MQSFDFIGCSKFEFVIKSYKEIGVYIIEFEWEDEGKSYCSEKG